MGKDNEINNLQNAKPRNTLPAEGPKIIKSKTVTTTFVASPTPLRIGGTVSSQDKVQKPITHRYIRNPIFDMDDRGRISALWEFDVKGKDGNFELNEELLPHVEFHVSKSGDPTNTGARWPSVAIILECYYSDQPMSKFRSRSWFSLPKQEGKVGWRNFCHKTHIEMPVLESPNLDDDEALHPLFLQVGSARGKYPQFTIFDPLEGDPQGLVFNTSAECQAFERYKPSPPGPGPSVDGDPHAE